MRADHDFYLGRLYPMQDRVLGRLAAAIGPIDLMCRDEQGQVVAIEVKRRGDIDGVEQLTRYIERLHLGQPGHWLWL